MRPLEMKSRVAMILARCAGWRVLPRNTMCRVESFESLRRRGEDRQGFELS